MLSWGAMSKQTGQMRAVPAQVPRPSPYQYGPHRPSHTSIPPAFPRRINEPNHGTALPPQRRSASSLSSAPVSPPTLTPPPAPPAHIENGALTFGVATATSTITLNHSGNGGSDGEQKANGCSVAPTPVDMSQHMAAAHFTDFLGPELMYDIPDSTGLSNDDIMQLLSQPHVPRMDMAFKASDMYTWILEAPISIAQMIDDQSLTYMNKGQYYNLVGSASSAEDVGPEDTCRASIYLLFHGDKGPAECMQYWNIWRATQQQGSVKPFRILEIDKGQAVGVTDLVEGFNGVHFTWRPAHGCKVPLRLNCLSTDFTPQKGVKGMPLKLQVDIYDWATESISTFRCLCQIKVFRDKGAERKNKDECKNQDKRLEKYAKQSQLYGRVLNNPFFPPTPYTMLQPMLPVGPQPMALSPTADFLPAAPPAAVAANLLAPVANGNDYAGQTGGISPVATPALAPPPKAVTGDVIGEQQHKRSNSDDKERDIVLETDAMSVDGRHLKREKGVPVLTLYVRKVDEEAYNAIYLTSLTVDDLVLQIGRRYETPPEMIKRVYKRTRKGLLVNVDDLVVQRLEDEDDFVVDLKFDQQLQCVALTLTPSTS
eukprot:comp19144_c1_seq2/m.21811 comp19144_c1_seq2/g.21811  ORF comp19144_c1_seq2/g.21811 comp19144_c1_seq2/m.21811 type:complete len:597 (-) comp19144_c1_seq2:756-2546(-)